MLLFAKHTTDERDPRAIVNGLKIQRMARPVCKGFVEIWATDQSASTYPVSEVSPPAKMEIRAFRSSGTERP